MKNEYEKCDKTSDKTNSAMCSNVIRNEIMNMFIPSRRKPYPMGFLGSLGIMALT